MQKNFVYPDMRGLPKWDGACKKITRRTGKPCAHKTIPGGYICRWHGGNAAHIQQSACYRYVAWCVTGCPEHRFYEVSIKALTRHLLTRTKLTDEQMLHLTEILLGCPESS